MLDLVASGRKVSEVAFDLAISEQAIYSWLRQDRIDRGLEPGLTTPERAELRAAKHRIADLEVELAIHRRFTPNAVPAWRPSPTPRALTAVFRQLVGWGSRRG